MKTLKLFVLLLTSTSIYSQDYDYLKVTYQATVEVDMANISGTAYGDAMKKATEKVRYYELVTHKEESNTIYIEKIDNSQPSESGIQVEFGASIDGLKYKNLKTKEILSDLSPYGLKIILKDSIRNYNWKITKEKKEILGFEVRKATATKDSITNLTAWYAPKIPLKNGPDDYAGLPGLILELEAATNYDNTETETVKFRAVEIEVLKKPVTIEKPIKGKIVYMDDFIRQQQEHTEKQMEMMGSGVDKD